MGNTLIEWTDMTWNPITGCDRISPGCKNCYAKRLHDMRHKAYLNGKKMPLQYAEPFEHVHCWPDRLEIPLRWRAPRLIFVNSGADIFHEDVPVDFLAPIFVRMWHAREHTFQFLTKRAERMLAFYWNCGAWQGYMTHNGHAPCSYGGDGEIVGPQQWPLPNVWPGVSVESKKYLWRLDDLRQIPAPIRMVSFEPLLEDLGTVNLQGIGWAIVGGESGPGARPMHPDWARSLRDQCVAAGVPFFFKQWGEWADIDQMSEGLAEQIDAAENLAGNSQRSFRVGKKKAGRQLDGREWNEFPKPYPGHQVVRLQRRKAA
jgi:protein gp37